MFNTVWVQQCFCKVFVFNCSWGFFLQICNISFINGRRKMSVASHCRRKCVIVSLAAWQSGHMSCFLVILALFLRYSDREKCRVMCWNSEKDYLQQGCAYVGRCWRLLQNICSPFPRISATSVLEKDEKAQNWLADACSKNLCVKHAQRTSGRDGVQRMWWPRYAEHQRRT